MEFVQQLDSNETSRLLLDGSHGRLRCFHFASHQLQFPAHDVFIEAGPLGMLLEETIFVGGAGHESPHWRPLPRLDHGGVHCELKPKRPRVDQDPSTPQSIRFLTCWMFCVSGLPSLADHQRDPGSILVAAKSR